MDYSERRHFQVNISKNTYMIKFGRMRQDRKVLLGCGFCVDQLFERKSENQAR